MNRIPLAKHAGILDSIEGFFWDSNAGPLENIFGLGENLWIMFGGGISSLVLMGLEAAGWDMKAFGKKLDESFGLRQISDLASHDPEKIAQTAADLAVSKTDAAQETTDDEGFGPPIYSAGSVVPLAIITLAADEEDETIEQRIARLEAENEELAQTPMEKFRKRQKSEADARAIEEWKEKGDRLYSNQVGATKSILDQPELPPQPSKKDRQLLKAQEDLKMERVKQEQRNIKHQRALMKEEERSMRARRRGWGGGSSRGWGGSVGRGALAIGLGGLFSTLFKFLADPKSKLSIALRGAGAFAASEVHKTFEGASAERQKSEPAAAPAKLSPRQKLERAVEQILGAE